MDLSFGIRIRSIATDVASSISAAELDHLKLELHIQFAILGRYEWHRSSSAERYIKRLFDNAIIALMNFRSAVINGRQVNTHHYLVHAVIWACRHMNLDASTPLNRREHIIMSPYQFLSGRQQNEFPWGLMPFGVPAYCNLPDKHKRASAEDETKTAKCYYLFRQGIYPFSSIPMEPTLLATGNTSSSLCRISMSLRHPLTFWNLDQNNADSLSLPMLPHRLSPSRTRLSLLPTLDLAFSLSGCV
mmetsp:Transcript_18278/g.59002  ORF Transcript_18278/g.59002 Transcript_18278/m.59002 type:complete len:245 (+) Transcript_18278:163-897(+)